MSRESHFSKVSQKTYTMRQFQRYIKNAACLMLFFWLCLSKGYAQETSLDLAQRSVPASLTGNISLYGETEPPVMIKPSEILKRFVETETRFREMMRQFTFRRDVTLQTIGPHGQVTGEYIRNSQFVLDDRGNRVERVLYHPKSTIHEMKITKEDIQDLACAQLFGFEMTDSTRYNITYVNQETINSRATHILELSPKQNPNPLRMRERFFKGRIWIDALSFQIVKIRGIALPQGKQRFPTFETWRDRLIGSDFLFPASTFADEILRFPKQDVHYKVMVKYYAYKRFASRVSITEIDQP
jgi:hypothetical protein